MEFHTQNINQYFQWIISLILEHLPDVILAVIIFVIGLILAKITRSTTQKLLFKTKLDKAVTMFLMQILHIFLVIFVILIALSEMGISTTPLTAAITALIVGIGMLSFSTLINPPQSQPSIPLKAHQKTGFSLRKLGCHIISFLQVFNCTITFPFYR